MSFKNKDREHEQFCKLFVGGLDYRTTEETLKSYFEKWGEIIDFVVVKDTFSKKSRGFGFVTFKNPDSVDAAQNERPHRIDDREVETKRAIPREESGNPVANSTVKKIFIGGLKDDVDEDTLMSYFKTYGNVTSVNMVADRETGKKRGFAFIEFDDYDPVDKIVLIKHHVVKGKSSEVKKALSKKEMEDIRSKSSSSRSGSRGRSSGGSSFRSGGGDSRSSRNGYEGSNNYNRSSGGGFDSYNSNGFSQDESPWANDFGSNYSSSFHGGPMRNESFASYRNDGPYGGGGGGSGGGGGGGGRFN